MAEKVTKALSGVGLWGVEFFLTDKGVYFSELSPRPHDTGMVTLVGTQNLSEFELHTPWRNLEQQNLGWDINLSRPEQFTRAIDKCVDIDNNEYNKMSNACFIFAQQVVNNNDAVQQNIELFNIALNKK